MDDKENPATPIPKKTPLKSRRRSVCVSATPSHKFSVDELNKLTNRIATPNIVREEVDFSPKPSRVNNSLNEPRTSPELAAPNIVREEVDFSPKPSHVNNSLNEPRTSPELLANSRDKTPPSFNQTEYETFAKAVPMNSTVLPGMRKPPQFFIDDMANDDDDDNDGDDDDDEEEEEEEEEASDEDDDVVMEEEARVDRGSVEVEVDGEHSGNPDDEDTEVDTDHDDNDHDVSVIQTATIRRSRQAVIHSSDEEENMEQVYITPHIQKHSNQIKLNMAK